MSFLFRKQTKKTVSTRPWGNFEVLKDFTLSSNNDSSILSNNVVIKKITVNPQKRLSYQSHKERHEHWYIIQGSGKTTINDVVFEAKTGQSFDIQINAKHRIENTSSKDSLIFIEISTGNFDENDIIRYEDDFGRI